MFKGALGLEGESGYSGASGMRVSIDLCVMMRVWLLNVCEFLLKTNISLHFTLRAESDLPVFKEH